MSSLTWVAGTLAVFCRTLAWSMRATSWTNRTNKLLDPLLLVELKQIISNHWQHNPAFAWIRREAPWRERWRRCDGRRNHRGDYYWSSRDDWHPFSSSPVSALHPPLLLSHLFPLPLPPLWSPLSAPRCVHFASLHPLFPPSSSWNANSAHSTKVCCAKELRR